MAVFVLVHGSFLASWCWRDVAPRLEARGHQALAFDLPGHGTDSTPVDRVSFQDYVDAIRRVVDGLNERPILVEHSMCTPIACAVEAEPDSVAALVFLAGLLPRNGSSLLDAAADFDPAYLAHAIWSDQPRSVGLSPAGAREFLLSDVSPDVVDQVLPLLTAEPLAPYEVPFTTTDERFGRVRRYYIETRCDRVVLPAIQRATQARMTFERVFSLDAGHCAFFSRPNELVSCLDCVAQAI
jgi:pimeloyl-ACP methyl ester carboxylesterase